MSRAQPQQARGFEFYNPHNQQQPPVRQLPGGVQPALSFQTTAPTLSASPCNQYVANPRLPVGVGVPLGTQPPPGSGLPGALQAEMVQFNNDMRRPSAMAIPNDADGMRRELEKSRAQIAQLEKTLKWWSDCTANWREKWSKEKAERRKLKEELAQVRSSQDQTMARELDRMKREIEDGTRSVGDIGTGSFKRDNSSMKTTGVGTGDTLNRNAQSSMERSSMGSSIPIESTANFELQELLAETSSALEHERTENAELKTEVDRLTAEQSDLKTELSLLKETVATLGGSINKEGEESSTRSTIAFYGLPESVNKLIESLQSKVEQLEKDVASRQMERLGDWNLIDRLESERALVRAENDRLAGRLDELEHNLAQRSGEDPASAAENFKTKELENLRAEAHCLRRLVNRQTQELDHVNFLLSNQETETKLLRSRLLQPWGVSVQRASNQPATSSASSGVSAAQVQSPST